MTHDQSFPGPLGLSVNNRVEEELPVCMFGFCLLQIIHFIVHTQFRHPMTRILIGKCDVKSAYWRAHLSAKTTTESLRIFRVSYVSPFKLHLVECHVQVNGAVNLNLFATWQMI